MDINAFYPAIPRVLILVALDWLLSKVGNRGRFVAIYEQPDVLVYEKPCRIGLRRVYRRKRVRAILTQSTNHGNGVALLEVATMRDPVLLDFETSYITANGIFLYQFEGCPQGTPTSVFYALLVATFIESGFQYPTSPRRIACFEVCRWMDDLYIVIVAKDEDEDRIFS